MAGPDNKGGASDEIAGQPGVMQSAAMVGPTGSGGYLMDGTAGIVPGMAEAKAFAGKDRTASDNLATFVRATAFGFDGYTNTAKTAGHDYLATDERAAGGIRSIAEVIHQAV
jgi:hypothetical protein